MNLLGTKNYKHVNHRSLSIRLRNVHEITSQVKIWQVWVEWQYTICKSYFIRVL